MTPEELARMQPGLNPYSYYGQNLTEQLRSVQIPTDRPKVSAAQQAIQFANDTLERVMSYMGRFGGGGGGGAPGGPTPPQAPRGGIFTTAAGAPRPGFGRAAFLGGTAFALPAVAAELEANRPLGAAAALGTGALTAGIGATLLKTRNPLAMAVGGGLLFAGQPLASMAARGAEDTRQDITGKPTNKREGEFATQMAVKRQLAELGMTQYRNNLNLDLSATKDLLKYTSDQEYLNNQRNLPLVNQMKNADLVRQQSLIASQGNQLARLNLLSTAGNLAQGVQSQTGETLRTMLTSNPYANAVLR
jgi:hypothetical protein